MNDLDNAFKNPERYAISDASFDRLLEARKEERRSRHALIAFGIIAGVVVSIVALVMFTIAGGFGG